ncbi:MAG: isoamylase early set domain-containing protein [Nitrospirota bacterium]|nr:isoamylase early set domain-containing protein [Nitrospirota bacterium]MDH5699236.1 isoamylase early set domain-containing protein [Nitrospirota bacterium]
MTRVHRPGIDQNGDDMDERDWLVQRFVDHDLSPQERIDFLKAMDSDSALRKQVLVTEQLLLASSQLPRIVMPSGLKADILKQLSSQPLKWWDPLWSVLFAPRVLQWNPAMAMVAACVLLGVLWLVKLPVAPQGSVSPPIPSMVKAIPLESDSEENPVMVRLVLLEPQARSVAVAGDFNGWKPQETPLQRTDEGAWTVTLQVKPGRYHYMFVVDGQEWVTDPFAGEYSSDGFGARNAILDVSETL